MRTPPLLADFSHARPCKPFCENSLTLPISLEVNIERAIAIPAIETPRSPIRPPIKVRSKDLIDSMFNRNTERKSINSKKAINKTEHHTVFITSGSLRLTFRFQKFFMI